MVIQVRHEPRKQVIIHEISIYDNYLELAKAWNLAWQPGMLPNPIKWVNGVAFMFLSVAPLGDFMSKEIVAGRLHWDHVSIASMPQFMENIDVGNGLVIPVVDVGHNEVFVAVGKFLRNKLQKKRK